MTKKNRILRLGMDHVVSYIRYVLPVIMLLFVTTVTLVPIFCFLKPLFWVCVHLACSCVMYYLASHHPHFTAFCINFTFFVICSVAAGWTMFKIRKANYKELIELEEERNRADTLAHRDSLTGLYNRQTHSEDARVLSGMVVHGCSPMYERGVRDLR